MIYYENVGKTVLQIEAELTDELRVYWERGEINTRFKVISFCMGFYGYCDEKIYNAIIQLYNKGIIKA